MTMRIEELWTSLRRETVEAQRRVDANHPLDLYADFEQPDRPGLILFCDERPNDAPSLKAIGIERRQRADGRWSMRVCLDEPRLLPVFAELCRDIIEFTRHVSRTAQPSGLVLSRIDRWRSLMLSQPAGLSRTQLRGLIGELLILERELLPALGPDQAVSAWTGPLGTSQDFRLPDGRKLEVKALDRHADKVLINGLDQLDGGGDPLQLVVVRLEDTGADAVGAVTAARLVEQVRARLSQTPAALQTFEILLRFAGWDDAVSVVSFAVRPERIDRYNVDDGFPRLTAATVPAAIVEATLQDCAPATFNDSMTEEEFRADLLAAVASRAEVEACASREAFVLEMLERLFESGEVPDAETCVEALTGQRGRKLEIDAWAMDEADGSLHLFVAIWDGRSGYPASITLTDAREQGFNRVLGVFEQSRAGWLTDNIEESRPLWALARHIQLAPRPTALRVHVLTDRPISERLREIAGEQTRENVPVTFQIWDVTRLKRIHTALSVRDDLVVDFSHLDGGGLQVLPASVGSGDYDGYLTVIPGEVLADIYIAARESSTGRERQNFPWPKRQGEQGDCGDRRKGARKVLRLQ